MNLGIDFGSTYSMFSVYDEKDDIVRALELTEGGSKYVPSIACYDDDDNLVTGLQAKTLVTSQPDLQPYRAFKMLLGESRKSELEARGYTDEITPRTISKAFLEQHIKLALNGEKQFDEVVICVPEVWNREILNISGKTVLRDICNETGLIKNKVIVVSEPAAASAFFAYNFRKQRGVNYDGHILIIDYGGGTLDITLTKVNTVSLPNGENAMEIDIIGQTGAGENHEGQVGDAGIAYMEAVAKMAILQAGLVTDVRELEFNGDFMVTLTLLESAMMSKSQLISDALADCAFDPESMADNTKSFTTIRYRGKKVPVQYATLYKAYQEVIRPVLEKQLDDIYRSAMQPAGIDPYNPGNEHFKIALVGGFGKFAMVQQQVNDKYRISDPDNDSRLENIGLENRESAISFGAALIADKVVTIRKTARQSIGLVSTLNGQDTFDYAITFHQDLKYDTIYFCRHNPDPNKPEKDVMNFWYGGGEFPVKFAIGIDSDLNKAYQFTPVPAVRKALGSIPSGYYACGFSMDESGIYTFHIRPVVSGRNASNTKDYELGSFSEIFGNVVRLDEKNALRKIHA